MTDLLLPFLFDNADVRGVLVQLEASLTPQLAAYAYPPDVARLLSEANAAACLLASTLKLQGRLGLQLQGSGSVRLLLAQVNDRLELRSLARFDPETQGSWSELVGDGVMALNLEPEQGPRYQGLVSLSGDSLAACIEAYFEQSEQLPTRLYLFAGQGKACGLLLQVLPSATEGTRATFQHLDCLASTLKADEALNLPATEILHRLFHQEDCRVFDTRPVQFHCGCSREKTEQALRSLPKSELEALLAEQGEAELGCDYCQSHYRFDAVDLAALIHAAGPSPSQAH